MTTSRRWSIVVMVLVVVVIHIMVAIVIVIVSVIVAGGRRWGWSTDKRFRDCWIISSSSRTSDYCVDKRLLVLVLVLIRLVILDKRLFLRYKSIRREILPVFLSVSSVWVSSDYPFKWSIACCGQFLLIADHLISVAFVNVTI